MYKGTGWTRGDLGNVPDPNPFIDCHDCGESYKWQDYWKPRVVEGDRVDEPNDPDEPWRCDSCHERHERETRRRKNNASLSAYQ